MEISTRTSCKRLLFWLNKKDTSWTPARGYQLAATDRHRRGRIRHSITEVSTTSENHSRIRCASTTIRASSCKHKIAHLFTRLRHFFNILLYFKMALVLRSNFGVHGALKSKCFALPPLPAVRPSTRNSRMSVAASAGDTNGETGVLAQFIFSH